MKKQKDDEYAKAGVNYKKIEPFKKAMVAVAKQTVCFPNARGVFIHEGLIHAHGSVYDYRGPYNHSWCATKEGLGNKNWIAEWMYQFGGTGETYYNIVGIDTALMAVNDLVAQGAMPVNLLDEVAAGDNEWFLDEKRNQALADGFLFICRNSGMALGAGESPAYRYLVRAESPVKSAPVFSAVAIGIIAPANRLITGENLQAGDRIIGVASSEWHSNGASLLIKRAMSLPEKFLTKLPNGTTLGEQALTPTRSYVHLMEEVLNHGIKIHAALPGTGSGISKLAFDDRPFTYRVYDWLPQDKIPLTMQFLWKQLGVSYMDMLTTFNMGIGYYLFVPPREVPHVLSVGKACGHKIMEVGRVEKGKRKTIFEPRGWVQIILPPPGD